MEVDSGRMRRWYESHVGLLSFGAAIGIGAIVLQALGNPPNMGLCVGCFMRDIAGGMGLHRTEIAQYVRPEVMGILLGAVLSALAGGKWRSRGAGTSFVSFVLGVYAMVGVLVFLGCPWRALLRIGAGDLTGVVGIAGFAVGVLANGLLSGSANCSAKQDIKTPWVSGVVFPAFMVLLLVLSVLRVRFAPGAAIFSSVTGPGSLHAPILVSLAVGLFVGVLAQTSRFCLVGAFRSAFFGRGFRLLLGLVGVVAAVSIGNLIVGKFRIGFHDMPLAHTNHVWSFLAMVLCGLAFSLADGCPVRQVVRSAEGDGEATLFCVGMIVGAGICHNWALTAAPDKVVNGVYTVGGPTLPAMIAVATGVVFCVLIGLAFRNSRGVQE